MTVTEGNLRQNPAYRPASHFFGQIPNPGILDVAVPFAARARLLRPRVRSPHRNTLTAFARGNPRLFLIKYIMK